MTLVPSHHL